jgi:CheY-like chemotaxis protein
VILTDLKMPGMHGFEFLKWLRDHPESSIIPVIVYSSSRLEPDVRKAYSLGANCYLAKPHRLDEMRHTLRLLYEFWSRCECPPMPSNS